MKKVITTLLFSLLIPGSAFAAFNDAQLSEGTTVVLSVGGTAREFTITSGNLETVQVNGGSLVLTLATGGSGVNITSANKFAFSYGTPAGIIADFSCNTNSSSLSFNGSGTVSVTPTGVTCTTPGGGGSGGGGGGGGGGSSAPATPATPAVPSPAPTVPATPAVPATLAVAQVPAATVATPSPVAQLVSPVFNKDLQLGSRSADVKRLQELLAQDKDVYPNGQATGYFGKLTAEAIRKFQLKHGVIKKATDPGNGRLGPKTRAKLKEVFGNFAPAATPAASPVSSNKSMQDQLTALLKILQELQAKAKKP